MVAVDTNIRHVRVFLSQAGAAVPKAARDGDMMADTAATPSALIAQSAATLTRANLKGAGVGMAAACELFD